MLVETPPPFATEAFVDAGAAVARLEEIYERNTSSFAIALKPMSMAGRSRRACAPVIRLCG
jgi:AMP nucleosidase